MIFTFYIFSVCSLFEFPRRALVRTKTNNLGNQNLKPNPVFTMEDLKSKIVTSNCKVSWQSDQKIRNL